MLSAGSQAELFAKQFVFGSLYPHLLGFLPSNFSVISRLMDNSFPPPLSHSVSREGGAGITLESSTLRSPFVFCSYKQFYEFLLSNSGPRTEFENKTKESLIELGERKI